MKCIAQKVPIYDETVGHYDRLAVDYDRRWRSYSERTFKAIFECLDLSGGEHILDVGCGTGKFEQMVVERFDTVSIIGMDISRSMLNIAQKRLASFPQVALLMAQAERLPFRPETFDRVLCANMLHNVRKPATFIQECARMLRPNGRFVLVDWCRDFWFYRVMHRWLQLTDRTYVKMFRVEEVRKMLETGGLFVTHVGHFIAPPHYGMMRLIAKKP
ncbi:MAG: methyltransferase domain-containing protein [Candidatus Omnitrophica bacterium]|nr:methyltransferase domain-containing protein [Candidatus Omnitrophota bacterium]